jgi:hypothetical protein
VVKIACDTLGESERNVVAVYRHKNRVQYVVVFDDRKVLGIDGNDWHPFLLEWTHSDENSHCYEKIYERNSKMMKKV